MLTNSLNRELSSCGLSTTTVAGGVDRPGVVGLEVAGVEGPGVSAEGVGGPDAMMRHPDEVAASASGLLFGRGGKASAGRICAEKMARSMAKGTDASVLRWYRRTGKR